MDASSVTQPEPRVLVEAQRAFFRTGATRPLAFRRQALLRLRETLLRHEAQLLAALHEDLGRPPQEAYASEMAYVLAEIDAAVRELPLWMHGRRVPTPALLFPATSRIEPEPYGNVLVISPWNYPVQLLLVPLAGAVAAGNCVIAKPSELAPATSRVLAAIIAASFETAHVACVDGGAEAAQALLAQRFDFIFFTGSTRVGRIVMAAAARTLTPVTLELGGKNPCVVEAGTDLRLAARRIAWGKFFNAGQTCVAPDFVLAHASVRAELVERLGGAIRDFYGAEPAQSPDFGRIVNEHHAQRLAGLLRGAHAAFGGECDPQRRYVAPTVLDRVGWDDPVMQDEIFGPILPVLEFTDRAECIARLQAMPKPLALYVFAPDRAAQEAWLQLSSGGACVNDTMGHLLNRRLPFGGVGESGMGAYHGRASFDAFSHSRSVVRRGTWLDPGVKYPPYRIPLAALRRWLRLLS